MGKGKKGKKREREGMNGGENRKRGREGRGRK